MAPMKLIHLLHRYLSVALTFFQSIISCLFDDNNHRILHFLEYPILIKFVDAILSLYFWVFCDLRPITVDIDGDSTVHFWVSGHRKFERKNLVMLHGYGGNSKWQFVHQVADLSKSFNVFIPDMVFFGKSYSKRSDRSVEMQARCVGLGMVKGLGVGRFSVYSISYGGFVAYRMAEIWPETVEKVVIVSSGVGFTEEQKTAEMKKYGDRDLSEILVPRSPHDLRLLVRASMNTGLTHFEWVPDFVLSQFIAVMYEKNRKELIELAKNLLATEENPDLPAIKQETLIVWGENDKIFPVQFAHGLRRLLPNSRLEIIKEIGHAVNIEAPGALNNFIISFVLDR
ncbi:PREDICTED: uncharacterized protein LOC104812248 [Tarenaya hassleriana]|uniref:uncharacterized protein LOC104812248 n=1 Tax=Tarenaya hassleriana TaxID=28532 RepID=UPI00053C3F9F|nr:PREDICTED: uncharacterized protein LOC104812248 [Tarenaya hassleriana]